MRKLKVGNQRSRLLERRKRAIDSCLLLLIFLIALFLRWWRLDKYPPGFTPDEAAQGYTAYSILKTGKDEWGVKFPLSPRSFGDFKPPLQTYLIVPSIAVFGLNEFAVRLPNALLGGLAILGVFLLAKELFRNKWIGLISAVLLAFSPWYLPLSRGAFEANLTVFFTSFGVFFLLKMFKTKHWLWQLLAAVFLGLNLFSYHSAKLITPIIILLFFITYGVKIQRRGLKILVKKLRLITFWLVFGFLFLVAYFSFFTGGQKRGLDIAVFHPTDNWQAVKDERWWAVKFGLPDFAARVFHNKLNYSLSRFSKNYLAYLSPQFLFSEGAGEGTYGMIPGRGVLWWWEAPVLVFVLYQLARKPEKEVLLTLAAILLAPIPAALTKGTRAANRAAVMMPWIQILTAASIWQLKTKNEKFRIAVQNSRLLKNLMIGGLTICFLAVFYLFISFLEDYFVQSPRKIARAMLYGRCQTLRWIEKNYPGVDTVIISRKLSEPQAYVMFCLRYPPRLAQKQTSSWLRYEKRGLSFVDQLGEYRLGKYCFKEINWPSDSKRKNTILVGLPEEFSNNVELNKIIHYPNNEKAILIVAD